VPVWIELQICLKADSASHRVPQERQNATEHCICAYFNQYSLPSSTIGFIVFPVLISGNTFIQLFDDTFGLYQLLPDLGHFSFLEVSGMHGGMYISIDTSKTLGFCHTTKDEFGQ
jgi:hypothetical protein